MSYCRWSSDGWKCDLYCYESNDGFVTHVANRRYKEPPPDPEPPIIIGDPGWIDRFVEHSRMSMRWLDEHPETILIGLAYDGETFTDETLEGFEARLLELRNAGYQFPDSVLDAVRAELAEEKP